jgi:hypothetical protein
MENNKSNEILIKTYTCWLSISCTLPNNEILPPNLTKEHLEEFFEVKAKEIGEFHSVKLEYVEIHKSFQCYVNFLTEDSAKQAVKLFDQIELENLKIRSEYRLPKNNKKLNPLLSHNDRTETAASSKNPLLLKQSDIRPRSNSVVRSKPNQSDIRPRSNSVVRSKPNQSAILPRSNSKACPKQSENIKRYVVIDGNNVAIQ